MKRKNSESRRGAEAQRLKSGLTTDFTDKLIEEEVIGVSISTEPNQ
jgi:hypothetical protein